MYSEYSSWCKERNLKPMGDALFGKEVISVFGDRATKSRPRIDGVRVQCYNSIKRKTPYGDDMESSYDGP